MQTTEAKRDVNDSKNLEVALTNVWTLIKINGELFVKSCLDTSVHFHCKANFLNQTVYQNPGTQTTLPLSAFKGVLDPSFDDTINPQVASVNLPGYPDYGQPSAIPPPTNSER